MLGSAIRWVVILGTVISLNACGKGGDKGKGTGKGKGTFNTT